MILADLTRVVAGTEIELLESLREKFGEFHPETVTIICFKRQVASLELWHSIVSLKTIEDNQLWSHVVTLIMDNWVIPASDEKVTIVSYHRQVLSIEKSLPRAAKMRLTFLPWRDVKRLTAPLNSALPLGPETKPFPLTRLETRNCIIRALQKAGGTTRQNNLRLYLQGEHAAFKKTTKDTGGFIKRVVQFAINEGIVTIEGNPQDINPVLHLKAGLKVSAVVDASKPGTKDIDAFYAALRTKELGPYSTIRPILFEHLKVVAEEGKNTWREVIDGTVIAARKDQRAQMKPAPPWHAIAKFLYNLVAEREVLLGNGRPIDVKKLEDSAEQVTGLAEEWAAKLEEVMLEAIIRTLKCISTFYIAEIAVVLYNNRSREAVGRVVDLISRLKTAGVVRENSITGQIELAGSVDL